jgi:hypothetical protein
MDDYLARLVESTAARWAMRLRERPSSRAAVLADLDADGTPAALALKAALERRLPQSSSETK